LLHIMTAMKPIVQLKYRPYSFISMHSRRSWQMAWLYQTPMSLRIPLRVISFTASHTWRTFSVSVAQVM